MVRNEIDPFAESPFISGLIWADVPPAMLERYETVKVLFACNDGFADYDWAANGYERIPESHGHLYAFSL